MNGYAPRMSSPDLPRPEYPRPSFRREEWLCLNGTWGFEIDRADTGRERGVLTRELEREITVPFCPESELSGVGETDFMDVVWYRKTFDVPAGGGWDGRRIIANFQAVDDEAFVWMAFGDSEPCEVARHRGGCSPFAVDLGHVAGKSVTLIVRARDDHRVRKPMGKQSSKYANYACLYTRTTGIWQSVWLEPVGDVSFKRPVVEPDVAGSKFRLTLPITAFGPGPHRPGLRVRATLKDADGAELTTVESPVRDFGPRLDLPVDEPRLWSPDDPYLYDIDLTLLDGEDVLDRATTYAGLRSVTLDGKRFLLNGRPIFQRLVLDQGYYPDGILTAPTDDALKRDIELAQAAGFNGARLHEKVFEERFLHHADRLGYLCWGEFPDWGIGNSDGFTEGDSAATALAQWGEVVERDRSRTCLVGWCPTNEFAVPAVGREVDIRDQPVGRMGITQELQRAMVRCARLADATRPVLDGSGWSHADPTTDIYDNHDYSQDAETLKKQQTDEFPDVGEVWPNLPRYLKEQKLPLKHNDPYRGQPAFCSEMGGTWWLPEKVAGGAGGGVDWESDAEEGWGYGVAPKSDDELRDRICSLVRVLKDDPRHFAYCYTQLTDVFQECNGVYRFDRTTKMTDATLRAFADAQREPAAIETE